MTNKRVDDLESTRIAPIDKMQRELRDRTQRDRAYLIVLAGRDVGRMYKLEQGPTVIGRSHTSAIRLNDDSISREHATISLSGSSVYIEDLGSANGTVVNGDTIVGHELRDGDKIRLGETTILKFTYHDRLDESFQRKMYDAALRDPLTKVFNKKYFLDSLSAEVAYAKRHDSPLSLLIFDLDHFKRVNDTYGHVVGDQVLVDVAQMVQQMLRSEDIFARYGGEEFAIICRGIELSDAGIVGERIRAGIEGGTFVFEDQRLRVTVSLGVAALHDGITEDIALVREADEALYEAKNGGRNRVLLKCLPEAGA